MSYVDWPDPQPIGEPERMWIEGYESLQHRINEMITHLAMADGYRMTMSAFTAEQLEQAHRQRELDRLRNEAWAKIQQLVEPKGYLT